MYSNLETRKTFRNALCTALAASLIAGSASAFPFVQSSARVSASVKDQLSDDKAIAKVEMAVMKNPHDASLRVELAHAYLGAGRFASAATAFEDAMTLGESSPGTALALALAYVGSGRNADATQLLGRYRESIPASDFGLAVALAGDTNGGVAILSDQLRAGADDVKLRQNLAYAYALNGSWLEARLMAAQDVPADQLDARISDWATQARPEDYRRRVASLIGAPVRGDSGMPAVLALSQPAAEAPALVQAEASDTSVLAAHADGELPAVESGESFWGVKTSEPTSLLKPVDRQAAAQPGPVPVDPDQPEPAPQVPALATRSEPSRSQFDKAFAEAAAAPDTSSDSSTTYISRPVVQPVPTRAEPFVSSTPAKPAKPVASASPVRGSSHMVQLGSFSTEANAKRAWDIYKNRYSGLRDEDLRITEAVVRGKKYWRVAAAGFTGSSARSMCSSVRGRGYGCIAYAASRPLPGALQSGATTGPMRARR